MEAVTVTIIVGIVTAVVSIVSYFAGEKKTSKGEVAERARFEGNVEATLKQILLRLDGLDAKLTRNTTELYDEIDKRIAEHEKRYHA